MVTTPDGQAAAPERNDEPIVRLEDEKLGYRAYADVLSSRILSAKPPATIGIYGSWGSGKTSLMRLIESTLLQNDASVRTIWIDVWQLSTQEEVWQAFLQALVNQIRRRLKWWRRIRFKAAAVQLGRNLYKVALVLTPALIGTYIGKPEFEWTDVFQLLLLQGPFQSPLPVVAALLTYGTALWALREPLKAAWEFDVKAVMVTGSYEAQVTQLGNLGAQFAGFVKDYVGENGRLVVFIDDLDRCEPSAVPEILDAIKLFAATDKCIYVLGLDHRAVRNAIQAEHHLSDEEDAARYLEKIIQIPFQLPALSPAAVRFYLRELFENLDGTVANVFVQGMEANPRALKRAVQIYVTWMDLADRGLQRWEVDPLEPELVAKWLTIQLRYRQLSELISRRKDHLLWLERSALRKAGARHPLKEEDARLIPDAQDDAVDGDTPKLGEAAQSDLDSLLVSGERRFNERLCRQTLDSYVYLGGTAGGLQGEIRARSQERSMLLSRDPNDRQKFVNQLLTIGGLGKYRELSVRDRISVYSQRLDLAATGTRLLTEEETGVIPWVKQAFEQYDDHQPEITLHVPARQHILGTAPERILAAINDGLDKDLAERERARPMINIPGFAIGRVPVTNYHYRQFLDAASGFDQPVEFGIVEYEAYCDPAFATAWESNPDRTHTEITFPAAVRDHMQNVTGVPLSLRLDVAPGELVAVLATPGSSAVAQVSLPLRWRRSAVLKSAGVIVLITIGGAWEIEQFDEELPQGPRFTVNVKLWFTEKKIELTRRVDWITDDVRWSHPVTNITWEDAVAYCVWLRLKTGRAYRLPKEPEWEAAATGDGFTKTMYPWGDAWNKDLANTSESGLGATIVVGQRSPEGDSPYAVADMAGNVWQWCADVFGEVRQTDESGLLWDDVRFRVADGKGEQTIERAARGGSFYETKASARTTCRNSFSPDHKSACVGFRVAIAAELDELASL